ncbi:MAG: ABC transporter substrate-binding protein [Chloroflexota bacterium]|nr:ABC transporter substrate-binding protein [Chloroflexota bacterium]
MKSTVSGLWRVLTLLIMLSLFLAACGGDTNNATTSPAAAPSAGGAATEASAPASVAAAPSMAASMAATTEAGAASAAGEATTSIPEAETTAVASQAAQAGQAPQLNTDVSGTVEMWHFWASPLRRTAIRRVISLCQSKLPNITVNETPKPFGDIWTANIAAVAAGSGMPDVIVEDRPQLVQRAKDNIATNLGELAQRDGIDGSQFWDFTWEEATVDGDPYGIPFETDVRVLYWNKQAFKEAGLDPEKPPTTWDELLEYADKLDKKNEDGTYSRIAFHPDFGNAGWNVWSRTNGAELVQDGKPSIDDPKVVETFDWIKQWYDRYGGYDAIQKFRSTFGAPPNDAFMSGKVAMILDINGYSSVLNFYDPRIEVTLPDGKTEKQRIDVGIGDPPYSASFGKPASWSGGFALSIPRGAPNQEAAWEFIKCATGPDGAASWSRDTSAMSANVTAAQDPALVGDPRWQFFLKAMDYSQGTEVVPQYPNWGTEIDQRRERILKGEVPAQQALDEAQQAINAQMSKQ